MKTPKILDDLTKQLKETAQKKIAVEVGWFNPEFAKIARINEFGAIIPITHEHRAELSKHGVELSSSAKQITIPPRPHRQQTINKNMHNWKELLAKLLKKTGNIEKSLEMLSFEMEKDYKETFFEGNFIRNSPITLQIRKHKGIGSTIPLYATGELQRMIERKVTHE
jgi:hypothetical protein